MVSRPFLQKRRQKCNKFGMHVGLWLQGDAKCCLICDSIVTERYYLNHTHQLGPMRAHSHTHIEDTWGRHALRVRRSRPSRKWRALPVVSSTVQQPFRSLIGSEKSTDRRTLHDASTGTAKRAGARRSCASEPGCVARRFRDPDERRWCRSLTGAGWYAPWPDFLAKRRLGRRRYHIHRERRRMSPGARGHDLTSQHVARRCRGGHHGTWQTRACRASPAARLFTMAPRHRQLIYRRRARG